MWNLPEPEIQPVSPAWAGRSIRIQPLQSLGLLCLWFFGPLLTNGSVRSVYSLYPGQRGISSGLCSLRTDRWREPPKGMPPIAWVIPTYWKPRKADENEDFHCFVKLVLLCLRVFFFFFFFLVPFLPHGPWGDWVTMLMMVGSSFLQEGVEATKGTIIWVVLGPPESSAGCGDWWNRS